MNVFELAPVSTDVDGDELAHLACTCSSRLTLCGLVDTADGFTDGPWPDDVCVVCADLDPLPCERCGR